MRLRKHLTLLLLLLTAACLVFSACGDAPQESLPESEPESVAEPSAEESVPENKDVPPEVKGLEGRTINVLCTDWSSSIIEGYSGEIIYSSEENNSAVDVAKKAVVDWVETQYDCTIDGEFDTNYTILTTVSQMVTSGTYSYDVIFTHATNLTSLVMNGLLTDLNSVNNFNFENSWWDQNAVKDLSLAGRLYFVCGDINTYDNLGTWAVLFNKTLKTKLNIEEDFYQTVREKKWTLDHFIELCKGVTRDSTGDGIQDESDTWAFGTETYNIYAQNVAGGLMITEKDPEDLPTLTVDTKSELTIRMLQKTVDFYNSDEVMVANGGKYTKYSNPWEETVFKAFREGRELFYECGMIHVASFRSMDDDFGILPIPMTLEGQDEYHTTVSTSNASFMAIPYGVPDVEDLALVLEAVAMKSQQLLTPEFYEVQLKYREFRDNESGEMLDLIFGSRSFDIGGMFNWGGIREEYMKLDTDFVSRFDTILGNVRQQMQNTIEDIQAG
ncbi:MAG: carbohydrate ABC transporter substrate-binding protein [Clostridia bacterium]|nr:carbohydrate ABC transporter substrate-binding protein [Clostridia bacterium]